jgi:hypothetical protein
MTQDEIIEMARQVGVEIANNAYYPFFIEELVAFAKLVAAKEREAVIKIIKETPFSNWFQADVIEAIRARGEQA